jgi:hypothetical protein
MTVAGAIWLPSVMGGPASMFAPLVILYVCIGLLLALVGGGLIWRIELARGIANVLCWVQICLSAISIVFGIFGTPFSGADGLIGVLFSMLDFAVAMFMVYLLGETDRPARS